MKKMSEVFELPVKSNEVYISPNLIERSKTMSVSNADVLKHAAHAINHVDALADALDYLIQNADGKVNILVLVQANDALAAYRGEK